jgi:uncharacterized protein (DUF2336 family)
MTKSGHSLHFDHFVGSRWRHGRAEHLGGLRIDGKIRFRRLLDRQIGWLILFVQHLSLIDELERAVKDGSPEHRTNTLRQVTDLFLHDANRLSDEQIEVFDDVLCLIAERIEKTALVDLAKRLTPIDNAPTRTIISLASHDEIAVAAPVLTGSRRLATNDLVEIARAKGQTHLLAISERTALEPAVTDILLDRGDRKVVATVATNAGARFSQLGFTRLVEKSAGDDALAEIVGSRSDISLALLRDLLQRATDAVKAKIIALLPPERRDEIEQVVARIAKGISRTTEHDYSYAESRIESLESSGMLNEDALLTFVRRSQQDELIVALARLSSSPIKTIAPLLTGHRNDAVLIPCKAADLQWTTVEAILRDRLPNQKVSDEIISLARDDYSKLAKATAQRALRFMRVRETAH